MPRSALHNAGGWLARRAAATGARPAVRDEARALSFAELDARTVRCAGWLRARGVGAGDRVAILMSNRSPFLEAVFAAARLGAIALPLNTRLAPPELRELLDDAEPAVLLHDAELEPLAARACEGTVKRPVRLTVGGDGGDAYELALAASEPVHDVAAVSPEDPMILMYTSGTTGVPKGALLPHRKTLFNSLNAQLFFDLAGRDRVLVVVPLFHSFGLQILSIPALFAGASLVLQRHFDAAALWDAVEAERVTFFGGVPTMFGELQAAFDARPGRDLAALRFAFTAGAAIPVERIHAFHARGILLKQGFGQTETSILCCLDAADAVRKAGSVGRPVFHAELRVVGTDALDGHPDGWRDVAPGETGEIVVRGPITMTGYWRRPDASAEVLRENGWLRTGDLATIDAEGFVTLVGRARDLFISGGENVYPAQVEQCYAAHPAIREIAVVGEPDPRWGEVGCAYVVLAAGAALDADALRDWGRERLASFKVPRRWVAVATLPRTVTGKVQKHRLPAG